MKTKHRLLHLEQQVPVNVRYNEVTVSQRHHLPHDRQIHGIRSTEPWIHYHSGDATALWRLWSRAWWVSIHIRLLHFLLSSPTLARVFFFVLYMLSLSLSFVFAASICRKDKFSYFFLFDNLKKKFS